MSPVRPPSGPGSNQGWGRHLDSAAPSNPTPSLSQCTAAGRWRRVETEHLEEPGIKIFFFYIIYILYNNNNYYYYLISNSDLVNIYLFICTKHWMRLVK